MTWVTVGVSVGSSILGASKEKKAAKIRAQAYGEAADITNRSYDDAEALLDPRHDQESAAMQRVNALLGLPGGDGSDPTEVLRNTPGYEWLRSQGIQARDRSAAGQGGLVSGNTLVALEEYGQGLADQTFDDYLQNVMGLQSQGVDSDLATMKTQRGNILSDFKLGAAGARASGVTGSANALIGGARSAIDTINYNRGLKRQPVKVGPPPSAGVPRIPGT